MGTGNCSQTGTADAIKEVVSRIGRRAIIIGVTGEQLTTGTAVWRFPLVELRFLKIFNLRSDPFEEADHMAMNYGQWRIDRTFLLVPAQEYVGKHLATYKEFPPSQKVGSFSLDSVLKTLQDAQTGGR